MTTPDIIYIDNHLLVINKPAGMLVQGDSTGDISLHGWAKGYLKRRFIKPGNVYLGLVHRLDRPVSGVVVFARTSKAASRLSEQFRKKKVLKRYLALVEGMVPREGRLADRIVRRGTSSMVSMEDEGQRAELSFRRLAYDDGVSLVEIDLSTGRHHQIRIQFASRGHPIVGDLRYGSKRMFLRRCIALHAQALTIVHPTKKETMTFTVDPAKDWKRFMTAGWID